MAQADKDVYEFAMQMEQDGRNFYLDLALVSATHTTSFFRGEIWRTN
jgi:rubrerythrin